MDIRNLDGYALPSGESHVIALGNFDGVHVAHTVLLEKTVAEANSRGAVPAVFTFSKHSRASLEGGSPMLITQGDEKLELFKSVGIQRVFVADFESLRSLSPEEFVRDVLIKRIGATHAVCGFNFRFGKNGAGSAEKLLSLMDGSATVIPPVNADDSPVSSTRIREAVEKGEMEYAASLLGRPFFICFPVVHGKELGRSIGVPTINQCFPPFHLVPSHGVYACLVHIGDKDYRGVANVGVRPTFEDGGKVNCETHIINYSGDLYGEQVKVSFYKKLRDEKRFADADSLREQIRLDIEAVNNYFGV